MAPSRVPVIDGAGVVGQVTNVAPFTAEVTLVTDKDHSIPVQVVRNGLRGVGDTKWIFLITVGSIYLLRLPLAWVLPSSVT